jgi:hypothetical protein
MMASSATTPPATQSTSSSIPPVSSPSNQNNTDIVSTGFLLGTAFPGQFTKSSLMNFLFQIHEKYFLYDWSLESLRFFHVLVSNIRMLFGQIFSR